MLDHQLWQMVLLYYHIVGRKLQMSDLLSKVLFVFTQGNVAHFATSAETG